MRKRNRLSGLTVLPIVISIASAHYKMLWLIPVTVLSMLVLVGTLPFCMDVCADGILLNTG